MPLPDLSPEQRAAALEKAAAARKARAELRERLKSKGATVGDVLKQGDTDEVIGKMRVSAVLESLPGRRQGAGREDHGAPGDLPDPPRARSRRQPAHGAGGGVRRREGRLTRSRAPRAGDRRPDEDDEWRQRHRHG